MRYKLFVESLQNFEHQPKIGWWKDQPVLKAYHGTNKKHISSVLKDGIDRMDPTTGKLSVALEPHTAHGYAAMSAAGGESDFRRTKKGAVHTPEKDRVVFHLHIPQDWAHENMDHDYRGNISTAKGRLEDKDKYQAWKKDNPTRPDHEYYAMTELRFKKPIPKEFIKGYSYKKP